MWLLLLSVLATPSHAVPLPQKQLTLSQFRADGRRSLEPINNFVLISPSYRQVRRQGRKGESLPIQFPTLKVRDPNELNFAAKLLEHEDSGPVFENSNSLSTEDIESKIREINVAIEAGTEVPEVAQATEREKIIDSLEELELLSTIEPEDENVSEDIDKEPEEFLTEDFEHEEETIIRNVKRVVVSIKTLEQNENIKEGNIKDELEKITELETAVYLNEGDSVIKNEFSKPGHLIFLDVRIDNENRISGNVFSDGRPLEELEGANYEEALNILNKVSELLDESLAFVGIEEEEAVILNKKIIVAINTAVFIDDQTTGKIKDSFEEVGTETAVYVNAPEDVIRKEFSNTILPIFVSISIDPENTVGGNVYYNSVPLENLIEPEAEEAYEILVTVKLILEESIAMQLQIQMKEIEDSVSVETPIQEAPASKKVVISLKSNLILTEAASAQLSSWISSQIEIDSILLVNRPTEIVQDELRGPTVPILLDMKIDEDFQLSGNIFYNYQPLENLNGQAFDEAMNILTVVKMTLTEMINKKAVTDEEAKETNYVESKTISDFNSLVETKIKTDEEFLKEIETEENEVATAEPKPEPELSSEPEPSPGPEPSPEPEPASEPAPEPAPEESSAVQNDQEIKIPIDDYTQDYSDLNNEFLLSEVQIPGDNEEGSGYFPSSSDKLDSEVIKDTPANVDIQVLNYGVNGVTEVPGRSHSATPGVDFGLIQEIRNI
eukprot:GFUD01033520.1.p1 GENE.GFUD01033520.1~~GFUD01033520.1.p1  ORF type:complete len:725 (+),score=247.58 GFUD01033520.1:133-2307(+)